MRNQPCYPPVSRGWLVHPLGPVSAPPGRCMGAACARGVRKGNASEGWGPAVPLLEVTLRAEYGVNWVESRAEEGRGLGLYPVYGGYELVGLL